jgi:hypothetical protein
MSLADWYLQKAAQCAERAKEAAEPSRRADYKKEQKVWRQLVREIEKTKPQSNPKI